MVYKKGIFELRSFTLYGYTSSLLEMLSIAFKAKMHCPLEVLQHMLACFYSDASHFFCDGGCSRQIVSGHVIFSLSFKYPERKKSSGVKSGEWAAHSTAVRVMMTQLLNPLSIHLLFSLEKKTGLTICFHSVHRYVGFFVVFSTHL